MSIKALERHLQPLMPYLEADGVTEICINRPQEIFVEKDGRFNRYEVNELEYGFLYSLAALVAESSYTTFPAAKVSGRLPDGERIQFVLPPACEKGNVVCSIRKQKIHDLCLDDYEKSGAFEDVIVEKRIDPVNKELKKLHQKKKISELITLAVQSRKNILISGGTGTGKTTFLNACLKLIPESERLITVEDTREVVTHQPNSTNLIFNENEEELSALNIFKSCLRLRPDRIFLSELRGKEVWSFLRAVNSGHPGSMSTVHADSPEGALDQITMMMQQAGATTPEQQIQKYIRSIIHIVIQLTRDPVKYVRASEVWLSI